MRGDDGGQVDFYTSPWRSLGIVALGLGFLAGCGAYLLYAGAAPASFAAFAMYGGLLLGAAGVVAGLRNAGRRGPVVSVGPAGIFDRRVSRDWLPWTAIVSISSATIQGNSFLMLEVDPAQDAALPITPWARRLATMNARIGYPGYAVAATALVGGFPALLDSVQRQTSRLRPEQAG